MIINRDNKFYIKADTQCQNKSSKVNWDLFDKIYCIHFLPFKEREQFAIQELKRIGVYQSKNFEFKYTVPNKYYEVLLEPNKFDDQIDRKRIHQNNINLQMNRLNIIRKAQLIGYNRILIFEDDNLFHRDLSLIAQYVNNMPLDYDIVNFDYWFLIKEDFQRLKNDKKSYINPYFLDLGKNEKVWNMSFVSLNNKAMKYLCDSQENRLRPMDNYIAYKKENDMLAKNIKFAISKINLSIQKLYDNRQNYHDSGYNKYDGQFLKYEDYI